MADELPSTSASDGVTPLSGIEARVLGCLVEKAATTPELYPLTLNAAVAACNQKTNREPVMNLELGAVGHALRAMEGRSLVKLAPASARALRYEHRFDIVYGTTARQRAVLCVMLLRGPQTLAELLTRSERLADFPSLDDVRDTLERLSQRESPLVMRLPRAPGQREERYMHLLCGPLDVDALLAATPAPAHASRSDLADRVEQLETDVATLRRELAALRASLGEPE